MNTFDRLLNEALDNTSGVTMDEYMKFATAIITSTSADKIPVAIEKAMALSPSELTQIIKQVQFTGDTQALISAMSSKSEYMAQFLELGAKVLPAEEIQRLERMTVNTKPQSEVYSFNELNRHSLHDNPKDVKRRAAKKIKCPNCDSLGMTWNDKIGHKGRYKNGNVATSEKDRGSYKPQILYCPSCDEILYYCQDCGGWSDYDDSNNEGTSINASGEYNLCAKCAYKDEPVYNAEGDYYNQGTDSDGH